MAGTTRSFPASFYHLHGFFGVPSDANAVVRLPPFLVIIILVGCHHLVGVVQPDKDLIKSPRKQQFHNGSIIERFLGRSFKVLAFLGDLDELGPYGKDVVLIAFNVKEVVFTNKACGKLALGILVDGRRRVVLLNAAVLLR